MKKVLVVFEYGHSYATLLASDNIEERWKGVEDMGELWKDDLGSFMEEEVEELLFHGTPLDLSAWDYTAHVHMNNDSGLVRIADGETIRHKGYVEEGD